MKSRFIQRPKVILFPIMFLLFSMTTSGVDESYPRVKYKTKGNSFSPVQQSQYEAVIEEAKKLYLEEMDNENALVKFKEAEDLAQTREQSAEVYFFYTLIHYAASRERGNAEFEAAVRRLIELAYYGELDRMLCPPRYLELFNEIKKDYGALQVLSSPPGAEVFVDGGQNPAGSTPLTIGHIEGEVELRITDGKVERSGKVTVLAGQEVSSSVFKMKRKSGLIYVLGGALAGGAAAVLLLEKKETSNSTGSIQVTSVPSGAQVFIDSINTGLITNCTVTEVSVGSHLVTLYRDGYVGYETTVNVSEGSIATVSGSLDRHTLTVLQPTADTIWTKGDSVEIKWETGIEGNFGIQARQVRSNRLSPNINIFNPSLPETRRSGIGGASATVGKQRKNQGDARSAAEEKPEDFSVGFYTLRIIRAKNPTVVNRTPASLDKMVNGYRTGQVPYTDNVRALTLSSVRIQLYKADTPVADVAQEEENSGSYLWTLPTSFQNGSDYKIMVSCAADSSISNESPQFMITHGYEYVTQWGSTGTRSGQFNLPFGIAVAGYVYVSDMRNDRIQKFTTDGAFIAQWGSEGSGDGQLDGPSGMVIDQSGNINVVEMFNSRVQKFSRTGIPLMQWGSRGSGDGQFINPEGLAIDNDGNIYVGDQDNFRVQKFTSNGEFLTKWGSEGSGIGQFSLGMRLAVDSGGNVYVSDGTNNVVQKFTSNGIFITRWGGKGSENGQFYGCSGIAIDNEDYVYVVDGENNRIQKFSAEGTFITKWGNAGSGEGYFSGPVVVAVDESLNVYVGEQNTNRIQKFRPNTTSTSIRLK